MKPKKQPDKAVQQKGRRKASNRRLTPSDDPDSLTSKQPEPPIAADFDSLLNAANLAKTAGDFEKAIACYHDALQVNINSYETWNDLGNLQRRLGETEKAITSYQKAICIKPTCAELHFNLGIALEDAGSQTASSKEYHEALRLKSKLWQALRRLGLLQLKSGQPELSLTTFKSLIQQRPHDSSGHCLSGLAYYQLKLYKQSASHHRKAIRIAPHLAQAHGWLGDALMKLGQPADALLSYNRAIELGCNDSEVLLQKAIALEELRQAQQAITIYEQLLLEQVWPPSTPSFLALALLKLGHNTQAFSVMRRYQCNHPSLGESLTLPGELGIRWNGIPLTNPDQTLVIIGDRDAGRSLHALTGLKTLNAGAAAVIICLPEELVELSRKTDISHEIIAAKDFEARPHQLWIPILDALALCQQQQPGNRLKLIKGQHKQRAWQKTLQSHNNSNLVVCAQTDDLSSPQLNKILDLVRRKNANIMAINQTKEAAILEPLGPSCHSARAQSQPAKLHRLSDLATMLKHCNLFITCNPLMAHLAGWMNVECWLVLAEDNYDWRWQHDELGRSFWYPRTLIARWNPHEPCSLGQVVSLLEPHLKHFDCKPPVDSQHLLKAA